MRLLIARLLTRLLLGGYGGCKGEDTQMSVRVSDVGPTLDPKLEAVLARLCQRRGVLFKTQAVKLPYLVDVIAQAVVGHRVTSGTHQRWDHGVVTREVFEFISGDGRGIFKFEPHLYSEAGKLIRLVGEPTDCLSAKELAIVDFVAEQWGTLTPTELGALTKNMNSEVPPDGWGKNQQKKNELARVDENAFGRLSEGWQVFCEVAPSLNLADRSQWSPAIAENELLEHFRHDLGV